MSGNLDIQDFIQNCEASLRSQYGQLLTPRELAVVLRYPSEEALLKAHKRGALPVPLAKFPNRRGYFVTVSTVARCLAELEEALVSSAGR